MSQHALWYKHRWNEVETSELLVETEKQTELLSGLPAKVVQDWDVYLNLNETVNTVQISVPMVEGLKRSVGLNLSKGQYRWYKPLKRSVQMV